MPCFYDVMKPKYGDCIRMAYTDTETALYIYIYQDLKDINDEMDFSGYDQKHKYYDASKKEVRGSFKDEVDVKIMTGFVGLRAKCDAFETNRDDKEFKKCKGTAKNTVEEKLDMEYNQVLETNEVIHRSFNSIE